MKVQLSFLYERYARVNHSNEISKSPDSTFIVTPNHRKTVSTTNLLNDSASTNSSLEDQQKNYDTINSFPLNINCNNTNINDTSDIDNDKFKSDNMNDDSINLSAINNQKQSRTINFSRKTNYLIAVHRKLSRQDTYFLSHHKSRPGLFGVPLLIPCYDGVTNKELYCSVWQQVARLLSPLPPTPPDQSNHATDCDDSLGYDFPFTLRAVADGGRVCALCPWFMFCRGCEIPCNDEPLLQGLIYSGPSSSNTSTPNLSSREQTPTFRRKNYSQSSESSQTSAGKLPSINTSAINIAIDWDPTALHLRYQSTRERLCSEHESVALCRRQQTEPVDLDHCLRAFTSEEKLEQWYHCSHCKGKQPATKKLQIWKLPPILIVHLKRFNYVNNKWVKSQKVVNFPFENFDPTPYLASVPQETILRHKELLEAHGEMRNHDCSDEITEFDREMSMINENLEENYSEKEIDEEEEVQTKKQPAMKRASVIGNIPKTKNQRQRLISTSLTKTPVVDGEFTDFHDHKLKPEQDSFDLKYQLYAVVCHSGMLNGGHYISYASNPNGSWYCYNDSSCREIPSRPHIDPGTAYLLFYERRNLDYAPYLPKVDDKKIPNDSLIDAEDSENDLRKMCVLS